MSSNIISYKRVYQIASANIIFYKCVYKLVSVNIIVYKCVYKIVSATEAFSTTETSERIDFSTIHIIKHANGVESKYTCTCMVI